MFVEGLQIEPKKGNLPKDNANNLANIKKKKVSNAHSKHG